MKKVLISVVLIILLIMGCSRVYAERFESLGMNITLPTKEYYNLKAAVDTNDAKIEFYTAMMGTTKASLAEEYAANSVLYNGINSNLANEIFIKSSETKLSKSIFHLNLASDNQREKLETELKDSAKAQGLSISTQESYTHGEIEFIYQVMTKGDLTVYQYCTIVNGQSIIISLNSSDSSAKKEVIKEIVDSISFDELLEKPVEITSYILIGITAILVGMVLVLMYMAFFSKKNDRDEYDDEQDEEPKE